MSYAEVGFGSDVYVWRGSELNCEHADGRFRTADEQTMLDHLSDHIRNGDRVPADAVDRLEAERDGREYETRVERALREFGYEAGR